jgi:low temperature requirement protein LtrA
MQMSRLLFRGWWRPPRRFNEQEEDRQVTWLELFYDLVYVVLIARVASSLVLDMTFEGIAGFIFLFIIVWLCWANGAIYYELHGSKDLRTRIFIYLQMFTVAGMAVFARTALTTGSAGFAFFCAAFLLLLALLWWGSAVYEPLLRGLTRPNAIALFIAALIFFASIFLPSEGPLAIWAAGLAVMLLIPLIVLLARGDDPRIGGPKILITRISRSMAERFALFTIIVLGEFVGDIIIGVADHQSQSWLVGLNAILAMLTAIGFWLIYFDLVAMHLPRPWLGAQIAWIYLHLPMAMGLVASAAAILVMIEYAGQPLDWVVRLVICGGLGLALLTVAGLMLGIQVEPHLVRFYRRTELVTAVCAVGILGLGFSSLQDGRLMLAIIALLAIPVILGTRIWISGTQKAETLEEA